MQARIPLLLSCWLMNRKRTMNNITLAASVVLVWMALTVLPWRLGFKDLKAEQRGLHQRECRFCGATYRVWQKLCFAVLSVVFDMLHGKNQRLRRLSSVFLR
jgi:uncharacterized membrane protein